MGTRGIERIELTHCEYLRLVSSHLHYLWSLYLLLKWLPSLLLKETMLSYRRIYDSGYFKNLLKYQSSHLENNLLTYYWSELIHYFRKKDKFVRLWSEISDVRTLSILQSPNKLSSHALITTIHKITSLKPTFKNL